MTTTEQQPAKDPWADTHPKRVWIGLSNVCEKGMFRVTLEVNGVEREMFHSYVEQEECVISEHHNLTWLLNGRDARIQQLEAERDGLTHELKMLHAGASDLRAECERLDTVNRRGTIDEARLMSDNIKLTERLAAAEKVISETWDAMRWAQNVAHFAEQSLLCKAILSVTAYDAAKEAK